MLENQKIEKPTSTYRPALLSVSDADEEYSEMQYSVGQFVKAKVVGSEQLYVGQIHEIDSETRQYRIVFCSEKENVFTLNEDDYSWEEEDAIIELLKEPNVVNRRGQLKFD